MSTNNKVDLQDWEQELSRLYLVTHLLSRSIHWSLQEVPCNQNAPAMQALFGCERLALMIEADIEDLWRRVDEAHLAQGRAERESQAQA